MKTNWAARYSGDEKDLGTLEAGKQADLVVLSGDYMTVPEDRISDIKVLLTMIGGRIVHQDAAMGRQ
jgi:predicted amidohydrolase YtcJ